MQTDAKLGAEIYKLLLEKGIETPMADKPALPLPQRLHEIERSVVNILTDLGLDLEDDSLSETPKRVSKMFCEEIFSGLDYNNFPKCTTIDNKMGFDEMALVRRSVLRSTCEHHLQPIYGRIHLGYIPAGKVLGLSKFTRIAAFFGARPQVQERLTEQVYAALSYILGTEDIAVVIEAEHFCMKMRGVEDACSDTVTSKMGGRFRTNSDARREVLTLIQGGMK